MRKTVAGVIGTLVLLIGSIAASARADQVDLQLVLAADVSRSIDNDEFELQRQGYVAALQDPRVVSAIQNGSLGAIAICYMEWAGPGEQKVVVQDVSFVVEAGHGVGVIGPSGSGKS